MNSEEEEKLLEAAFSGDVQEVSRLLASGVRCDATDGSGLNPLHLAAYRGHIKVVPKLVQARVDVNQKGAGKTALHWAACGGNADVVRVLLASGAEMNILDDSGATALRLASQHGHDHVFQSLLDININHHYPSKEEKGGQNEKEEVQDEENTYL